MSLASLQQGALIRWKGYQFRVEGPLPDKRWLLQNIGTGLLDNQRELELLEAIEIGELIFIVEDESPLDDGDESFQEQLSESVLIAPQVSHVSSRATDIAANKVAYIKAIETVDRPTREEVSNLLQATWKKIGWPECQPPAYSTALGWRTKAKNKMDPFAALRDRHDKKGRRGFRYHADVYQVLRNVLKHNYMRRSPRISITKAAGIAADKVRLLNATLPESERHPLPGRKAFISVLREEDACPEYSRVWL